MPHEGFQFDHPRPIVSLYGLHRTADAFDAAWHECVANGAPSPRLEDWLQERPDLPREPLLRELLATELEYHIQRGIRPSAVEYHSRFADDAPLVDSIFAELLTAGESPRQGPADTMNALGRPDTSAISNSRPRVPRANARAAPITAAPDSLGWFGDYELLQEIARGGMGVVYKARQTKLNRIVALKLILAGQLAGQDEVKRFYTEAEAAAALDHPGIVPAYEVGQQAGQHFFAMGFVEGQSLAAKLAEGPLDPKGAAQIVRQVAEAVQYAHERGIIHRDLKPGNILLDTDGRPRVTDFGLAKRLSNASPLASNGRSPPIPGRDSGENHRESHLTGTGQILGTPSFMPPEQAVGRLDQVGPWSDVYALGAVLYALLAGRPPFQSAHPMDTLRQVLDQEPVAPRQLDPRIPRDLETICLKCLEKDLARRYASSQALADELDRYLRGEPILARPVNVPGRVWRWCRRKPVAAGLVAMTSLLVLVLSVGGPVVAWREGLLRTEAEQDFQEARQAVDNYTEVVQNAELLKHEQFKPLRRDLLKDARGYYGRLIERSRHRSDRLPDLALAMQRVAEINDMSGDASESLAAYEQTNDIFERLVRENPTDTDLQNGLARSHLNLGNLQSHTGAPKQSLESYGKALEIHAKLAAENPAVAEFQSNLAKNYNNLGILQSQTGDPQGALASYNQAIEIQLALVAEFPALIEFRSGLADSYNNLGNLLRATGNADEALATYRQALTIRDTLAAEYPAVTEIQCRLAHAYNNLGWVQSESGKPTEALESYEHSLKIRAKLAAENPIVIEFQSDLADSYLNLGKLQSDLGELHRSLESYGKALEIHRKLASENPTVAEFQSGLAGSYNYLGNLQRETGDPRGALTSYQQSLTIRERLAAENPTVTESQRLLAEIYLSLGTLQSDAGDARGDGANLMHALSIFEKLAVANPTVIEFRSGLSRSHNNLGLWQSATSDPHGALSSYRQAVKIQEQLVADDPTVTEYRSFLATIYNNLGVLQSNSGDSQAAFASYEQALTIKEKLALELPHSTRLRNDLAGTLVNMAILEQKLGRPAAARELLAQAVPHHEASLGPNPEHPSYRLFFRNNRYLLSDVCLELGRHAEAAEAARQLAEYAQDANDVYNAACRTCRCIGLSSNDAAHSPAEQTDCANRYADQAMRLLTEAVAQGWGDAAMMRQDRDLEPLHGREEFESLLLRLDAKT